MTGALEKTFHKDTKYNEKSIEISTREAEKHKKYYQIEATVTVRCVKLPQIPEMFI